MMVYPLQPIQIFSEELGPAEKAQLLALRTSEVPVEEAEARVEMELKGESVIPLRLLRGIPFLRVRIDGQPYLLQLDFGSRYTLLQPVIALRHRLPLISEELQEGGPDRGFSFYLGRVREIRLGAARVQNEIVAIPLQKTSVKLFGLIRVFDYQGLVGAHTLKHFAITLDLAGRRLSLHPPEELPKGGIAVPFTEARGLIILRAFLNDHGPFQLLLDPGAPVLVLAPQIAEELGFGKSERFSVELKIEGLPPLEQPVLVHEALREAHTDGMALHGLLGRSFLKRWQVTISYKQTRLYFKPPKPP